MPPLVAIGDSLTQGFQSGAICKTHLSYPALIAKALTIPPNSFQFPDFSGPARLPLQPVKIDEGGLPLNIEDIARILSATPLKLWDDVLVGEYLLRVKSFWEHGPGSQASTAGGPFNHNLAVWGFEVGDANTLCEGLCRRQMARSQGVSLLTTYPMYRTAKRTLNPHFDLQFQYQTQIDSAVGIGKTGKISNLIFWLGANNALGTILRLNEPIHWSAPGDLYELSHARTASLWAPELFETLYRRVAQDVQRINAGQVLVANIPHLHIPPVARGVSINLNDERDADGYYEYYTPCWVADDQFRRNPDQYPFFTRDTMRMIDMQCIDQFNKVIKDVATQNGWIHVDMCALLDSLAFRSNNGLPSYQFPPAFIAAMQANPQTATRFDGTGRPIIDTRYLQIHPNQANPVDKYIGGVFSLDGVHPTTIGYGLVAYEFLKAMGQGGLANQGWWDYVIAQDTLVTNTPLVLDDMLGFVGQFAAKGLFQKVLDVIAHQIH